jgi:hypothetical protein
MNKTLIAIAMTLALATPALAEDAHHPEQAPAAAAQAAEKAVPKMQENVKKMEGQLERLAAAKTPEERQKLLMEHMQTMRENMMMGQQIAMGDKDCPMMGMMGGGMGMGMMGGGGMMMGPGGAGGDAEPMMNRMQQMERRMDMMERQMGGAAGTPPQGR